MKQWLADIREHARSKWLVSIVVNFYVVAPRTCTRDDGIRGRISRAWGELAENKSPSSGKQGGWAIDSHSPRAVWQEVAVVEEFVYLGSFIHS